MTLKRARAAKARSTASVPRLPVVATDGRDRKNLLVEDRGRRANGTFIDDETHRIRADIDNADRLHFRGTLVRARDFFPPCQF